ncbi:helix-turn-helix transcriptional regulator [Virgibacillus sp. 7505]|uniref:helix-turn-helix domain-containing protein n=1 Tax=Virgibacillus sp. 7505 TaxID=2022548 RepID=UPI001596098C|nr:helix-turn-helix transcriptional regulator [Virgibacillus sp. 7505]
MLGDRLYKLRVRKKKTQQEIADVLNITRPAYVAYEKNRRKPDYDMLIKLSEYFDVSTDFLLKGEDFHQQAKEIIKDADTNIAASDGDITEEEAIRALEFILKREKNRKPGDKQ